MRCTTFLRSATASAPARAAPPLASRFSLLYPYATRWTDNDVYGHLNNGVYGHLFDSSINAFLSPLPSSPSPSPAA